jgi:pimeloyl-ACP methyl ester carboxylesterase
MPPKAPVFVLVHGAAHGSWVWNPLTTALATAGLRAITVDLPSTTHLDDTRPPQASFLPDVQAIRATVEAVLDTGDDVVVVAHSYAGVITGEAIGLLLLADEDNKQEQEGDEKDKKQHHHHLFHRGDKESGGKGRIRWLVYLAAYPVPKGVAMWNVGDGLAEAEATKSLSFLDIKDGWAIPNAAAPEAYMGDLPEAERAQWATRLGKFSLAISTTPTTAVPGWVSVPSSFVRAQRDVPFPAPFQDRLIERARVHAVQQNSALVPFGDEELGLLDLDCAHNVMLSQPEAVKDLLVKIVGRLEKEH